MGSALGKTKRRPVQVQGGEFEQMTVTLQTRAGEAIGVALWGDDFAEVAQSGAEEGNSLQIGDRLVSIGGVPAGAATQRLAPSNASTEGSPLLSRMYVVPPSAHSMQTVAGSSSSS